MKNEESSLQISCIKWFDYQYKDYKQILFAVPNGHKRNAITAAIIKKEGGRAGVSDIFFAKPKYVQGICLYHGLFIEMKFGKNKQADTQISFEKAVTREGYLYKLCYSFDEFKKIIEEYLSEKK